MAFSDLGQEIPLVQAALILIKFLKSFPKLLEEQLDQQQVEPVLMRMFWQPAKTQVNLDPAISGMTSPIPMSGTTSSQPLSYLRMSCVSNVARSRELPSFLATVSETNKHSQLRIFNSTFLATKGHASQPLTSHQLL